MKRFLSLLVLFAGAMSSRVLAAPYPLGTVAATFNYTPSKLLADPGRTRVYAADPVSNSVIVIDTTTLKVIATVPIGSNPVDMAISPDGTTLYVANNGSTLAAVGVLDLTTLTFRGSYALPGSPVAIAAGLGGRVYCSITSDNFQYVINQFDGATGTIQATFNENYYDNNLFQISPDGTTLFEASKGIEPGTLKSFDVSTPTPGATPLQTNYGASENDSQLVISHHGQYICVPSGGGNPGAPTYSTFLFSSADINANYGSFANGAYPGPLAFSPDDSLVYQARYGLAFVLDVFNTQTFIKTMEVSLPSIGSEGYPDTINSIVADSTGSYLFISESSSEGTSTTGQLAVITTGSGTLTPSSVLPVITSSLSASPTEGTPFTYQITAANAPTSFNATNLPAGLTVNTATGLISGTPTDDNFYESQISATNASGTATATVDFDVQYGQPTPVITTTTLPNAIEGQSYTYTIAVTNAPYNYAATGLPAGLSIDPNYGVISGVPTTPGTYSVMLSAGNDYGTGTATVPLTVTAPVPVIDSSTAAAGKLGVAFSYQLTATDSPTSFEANGLPSGLSLNSGTGLISGVPTEAGIYSVALIARNEYGTGTATLTLTIALPVPVISSSLVANGTTDEPFEYVLTALDAPTSFAASGLPAGLNINGGSGLISGTPTVAGTYAVAVSATNASGTARATLSLRVAEIPVPAIDSLLKESGTVGQAFSYRITARNDPTSFSATGLPDGLSVNSVGLISGAPRAAGTFTVSLAASNAAGTDKATLTITVAKELPVATLVATAPSVTLGTDKIGKFTVRLSSAQKSAVVVKYKIKGSAKDGTDYDLVTDESKFKPGKKSKPINIAPEGDLDGAAEKTVKITLEPGPGYTVGTKGPVTVKILAGK